MIKYDITLYSKTKESLKTFLKFLAHDLKWQNNKILINYRGKKKIIKKITVLKSPHVNKTAQEQFELKTYSAKVSFYSYKNKMYLLMLKKIKNKLFPDIKIRINIEGSIETKQDLIRTTSFNPNYFTFNLFQSKFIYQQWSNQELKKNRTNIKNKHLLQKTLSYLKLLRWYGT